MAFVTFDNTGNGGPVVRIDSPAAGEATNVAYLQVMSRIRRVDAKSAEPKQTFVGLTLENVESLILALIALREEVKRDGDSSLVR